MKAVIYSRYSSDNQWEKSIEGQLRECTVYCKKNDITILRTYIDRAMSAKTATAIPYSQRADSKTGSRPLCFMTARRASPKYACPSLNILRNRM